MNVTLVLVLSPLVGAAVGALTCFLLRSVKATRAEKARLTRIASARKDALRLIDEMILDMEGKHLGAAEYHEAHRMLSDPQSGAVYTAHYALARSYAQSEAFISYLIFTFYPALASFLACVAVLYATRQS